MAHEILGDACAFIPGSNGAKNRYMKIGVAMKDHQGRMSLKLDTLPLSGSSWEGWINIFPRQDGRDKAVTEGVRARAFDEPDDDIPF